MKSIHFCTEEKLEEVKREDEIWTVRTGWIPSYYPSDIIKVNERVIIDEKNVDTYLFDVKVISCTPILYKDFKLLPAYQEEINRYHRKFDDQHYFFMIRLSKNLGDEI